MSSVIRASRRSATARFPRVLAVAVAMVMVVAACSGSDDASDDDDGASGTEGPPQVGGSVAFGQEAESAGGFCIPEAQLAASGINVAAAVYDTLTIANSDNVPRGMLAESIDLNEQATEFTFTLRDGITFHDGSPLDAEIVALNLNLWRGEESAVAATGRRPLLFPLVFDNVTAVDVVDDRTVSVTTGVPWPAFLLYLSSPRFGIAAESQLTSEGCSDDLVGTGPFQLESWDRNQEMRLERNADYWQTDSDGQQLPYLDELVFIPIPSAADRAGAMEAGTVDAAQFQGIVGLELGDDPAYSAVVEEPGIREVNYLLFNTASGPLADANTRDAFVQAVDRSATNDVVNSGRADIAEQPFDTEALGYVEGLSLPDYDPDAAADYFGGRDLTIRLSYATHPQNRAQAEELARQLEAVGVTLDIDEKDQSTVISQALSREFDIIMWRGHMGVDPDVNWVNWMPGMPGNFGGLDDPGITERMTSGRSAVDEGTRRELYQAVSEIFAEELYALWNWYTDWSYVSVPEVHGLASDSLPDGEAGQGLRWGWSRWAEVWTDQDDG